MTTGREKRATVERLFHAALARSPDTRTAFLVEACGDDDELRREVAELLAQVTSAEGPLDRGALAALPLTAVGEASSMLGRRIGPYEILALIGSGGMGEVYRARDTRLGRDVAVKLLPPDLASSPDRLVRFEREARILASLNHTNIAAIYGIEETDGVRAIVLVEPQR